MASNVEDVPRGGVEAKLQAAAEARERAWGRRCACTECDCSVKHRFGKVCPLCRTGDHYQGLETT